MAEYLKKWARERWRWLGGWGVILLAVLLWTCSATWPLSWIEKLGEVTWPWFVLGVLVALVVGHYVPQAILAAFRRRELDKEGQRRARVVGLVERVVLAVAVTASVEAAVVGSGALVWIGAKMAANWRSRLQETNHEQERRDQEEDGADDGEKNDEVDVQAKAMSALLASLVGLSLAVAGGLLIRASLP